MSFSECNLFLINKHFDTFFIFSYSRFAVWWVKICKYHIDCVNRTELWLKKEEKLLQDIYK